MQKPKATGFTLIELMIVVVVLGIIAAIAFPSYTNYVQKARRADATTALLGAAQQLERCFTRYNRYTALECPKSWKTEGGFYEISGEISDTSFTLKANPMGRQSGDNCGIFTLDQTGTRTAGGDDAKCWGSS